MKTSVFHQKWGPNWSILISAIIFTGLIACDNSTGSIEPSNTSEQKSTGDTGTKTADPDNIVQITTDPADQMNPNISVDRLVYDDNRNGNSDIFMYCLTDEMETQITFDTTAQTDPDISEGRIVWSGTPAMPDTLILSPDIFFLDIASNEIIQLSSTDTPIEENVPKISGERVIWDRGFRQTRVIYSLEEDTSSLVQLGSGEGYAISENRAVFSGQTDLGGSDLYLYEFGTGREVIVHEPGESVQPDIHGDHLVWQDNRTGNEEIFLYDLETDEETQITSDQAVQSQPTVYYNHVVWVDDRNGNNDIFHYDVLTQTVTQITSDEANQRNPAIYSNYLVWEDNRNGNWDIFYFNLEEL